MKKKAINVRLIIIIIVLPVLSFKIQAREVITLQTGWKFAKGNYELASQISFDDSQWKEVTIPHDWAIEGPVMVDGDGSTGKLPWRDEAWYRKKLEIPASYAGKQIYLVFDGIMSSPKVYINGKLAGEWDYGYSSFYLDVTGYLEPGKENMLAVYVDTRNHGSRWYPGAGIYRKVQMVVVNPVHTAIWGTYVTTPIVKHDYADVRIMTTVFNHSTDSEANIKVENTIINPEGKELATRSVSRRISSGKNSDIETTITLTKPRRWDIDDPVLYQVRTTVYKGEEISDTYSTPFGIRTIRFTADNGFYLNDRRVQFYGVNLHHDQGPLGAAFYTRAMERQLEIMKSMGCNAIRTSHNIPAPELLDLCDKMGLLVFNEAFDKYDNKADIFPETDFEDYAHRNIRNFVVRDRNHPSVFIWSVGNEIGDIQSNRNNGFQRLNTMVNYVRKYDPSRPVTMACDNQNAAANRHFDYYDVLSYNYGQRWSLARQLEPNKSVIISESASTVSTRGFYELPLPEEKTAFTSSLQVSSYDLHAPAWAEVADDDFRWQQEEEYIAGEFVWTGFDYIGEPTPYGDRMVRSMEGEDKHGSRSSYFGIVDLCGIPKDRYYLYKSYWNPDETTVHILPHWNWDVKNGENVPVFVYTNGDCAELFLNGKSMGMKCKNPISRNSIDRYRLMWNDIGYQPGELMVVAYKEGKVIGEKVMKTAGEPYEIRLTPDRKTITSGGMDLSYILIEAFDRNGNPCPLAANQVEISIKGPGKIAGVGNGNPQSLDPFQADYIRLFSGKALLIIRSDHEKGDVEVTATSKGLKKSTITVEIE
jgi:beta-galactosidase